MNSDREIDTGYKKFEHLNHFPDPLKGGGECQVAEYHEPTFDEFYPPPLHYLFGKRYDASGQHLKEIIASFTDDIVPSRVLEIQLDLQVIASRTTSTLRASCWKRGRILFIMTSTGIFCPTVQTHSGMTIRGRRSSNSMPTTIWVTGRSFTCFKIPRLFPGDHQPKAFTDIVRYRSYSKRDNHRPSV